METKKEKGNKKQKRGWINQNNKTAVQLLHTKKFPYRSEQAQQQKGWHIQERGAIQHKHNQGVSRYGEEFR